MWRLQWHLEGGGKQEVAGASPALATELLRALAREQDRRRGGQVGWAACWLGRPAGWAGQLAGLHREEPR